MKISRLKKLWTVTLNIKTKGDLILQTDGGEGEIMDGDDTEIIEIDKIIATDSEIVDLITNPKIANNFITFIFPIKKSKRIVSVKEGVINHIQVEETPFVGISKRAEAILKKYSKTNPDAENV